MEIRQIYYVLEISKQKSFSKAAKALFITQPTISQQITTLENELQVKLFNRDTHNVSLTKDGEKFCEYGYRIIEEVDNLTAAFNRNTVATKDILNIGVFPYYKTTNIATLVSDFYSKTSNVVGSLKVVENYKAYDMLENGTLDFAILKSRVNSLRDNMKYETLEIDQLTILVNSNNPLAAYPRVHLNDLNGVPVLTGETDSHYYNEMQELYESNGIEFNPAFLNNNEVDMMLSMIANDIGINIASESVGNAIHNDKIVSVPIVPSQEILTFLVYPKDKHFKDVELTFKNYILHNYV